MMRGKRVMVVGGTGKIGKHLVPKLVGLDNEVHVSPASAPHASASASRPWA